MLDDVRERQCLAESEAAAAARQRAQAAASLSTLLEVRRPPYFCCWGFELRSQRCGASEPSLMVPASRAVDISQPYSLCSSSHQRVWSILASTRRFVCSLRV